MNDKQSLPTKDEMIHLRKKDHCWWIKFTEDYLPIYCFECKKELKLNDLFLDIFILDMDRHICICEKCVMKNAYVK